MAVVMSTVREVDSPQFREVRSAPEVGASRREIATGEGESSTEEKVFVAVGKEVEKNQSLLVWALRNFGRKRICVLHVHQPDLMISVLGGSFPVSALDGEEVRAHREKERQAMLELLDQYSAICLQAGVRVEKLYVETACVENGILELITKYEITNLVMGGAADKHYPKYKPQNKKMVDLKSKKAMFVRDKAPASCQIWFICKGYLIYRRAGSSHDQTPAESPPSAASPRTGQLKEMRSRSVGLLQLPYSKFDFLRRVRSANYAELSPDVDVRLSRLSRSDEEVNPENWGRPSSLDRCAPTQSKEDSQPPPPTVLQEDKLGIGGSLYDQLKQAMEDAEKAKKEAFEVAARREEEAIEAIRQAQTSEDLYLKEQKQRREIEEALAKEKELLATRCEKAEKEAIQAIHQAQTSKGMYLEERKRRKEVEEALVDKVEALAKLNSQLDEVTEERRVAFHKISKSKHIIKELEDKIISAVELLQVYKKQRDELQAERDSSLREVEELRISLAEASNAHAQQFIEFSASEIKEATDNFDPSLKIGEGGYGSVYKGCLRHTHVAIKMLSPNSRQGTSEFQQEVKVLSKMRHPNLVTLIGACPEARVLIYEYMSNGSLEDQLSGQNSPPLSWQTRIRIATELCEAIIFLHSCRPHSIVHGDLKPANILLDANFVTKLADFGMCRLLPSNGSNSKTLVWMTDNPRGTPIYIDPDYLQTGELTPKSDVYSFGVILLRLLTGRQVCRIVREMQSALNTGRLSSLLDSSAGDWPLVQAEQLAHLALRCCELNRKSRPDLGTEVLKVLEPLRTSSQLVE